MATNNPNMTLSAVGKLYDGMQEWRMARHKTRAVARFQDHVGSVDVYEHNGYRSLCFTGQPELTQGSMSLGSELGFRAEYLRQHVAAALAAPNLKRVLCLGLGIGALPRLLRSIAPTLEIDAVERQPAVFAAANEYFGLRLDEHFRVHFAQAENFVHRRDQRDRYDLVFIDCFNGKGISPRCSNLEFYNQVRGCLGRDGLMVTNLIHRRAGDQEAMRSALSVLNKPWAIPAQQRSNCTIFGCHESPLDLSGLSRRVHLIDQSACLPFQIAPEVERIVPAATLMDPQ